MATNYTVAKNQLVSSPNLIKRMIRLNWHHKLILAFITSEGRTIPKGTNVSFLIDALHRVEEFWEEPNEFRPERFSPENSKNRDPYSYIPFSVGEKLETLNGGAVISSNQVCSESAVRLYYTSACQT